MVFYDYKFKLLSLNLFNHINMEPPQWNEAYLFLTYIKSERFYKFM